MTPTLSVNVGAVPDAFGDVIARFQACLAGGRQTEMDTVSIRIATAAMTGVLSRHPMIQGLILATTQMIQKEDRGIFTLAGRPQNISETEQQCLADAAMQLSIETNNKHLARSLGIASARLKTALDDLHSKSLPCPGLALFNPEVLKTNWNLIDQRFVLQSGAPQRNSAFVGVDLACQCHLVFPCVTALPSLNSCFGNDNFGICQIVTARI